MSNSLDSYKSIFLDISLTDFSTVRSFINSEKTLPARNELKHDITELWSRRNHRSSHYYIPVLCVRTGFDLFLRANKFAAQSEIIMSAINIPSMVTIAQCHDLNVVPCDINLDTFKISIDDLRKLVTPKTVAILYAHIYGRCVDVSDLISFAQERNIYFIEDCAESFSGFCSCTADDEKFDRSQLDAYCPWQTENANRISHYVGHPQSHLVLFSFGVLKYCTSLGGSMVRIVNKDLYERMLKIYDQDPIQETSQYEANCKKYFLLYWLLNVPSVIKPLMHIIRAFKINHMEHVIRRLRAFDKSPDKDELFAYLRRQPCRPLMMFLNHRFKNYTSQHLIIQRQKAIYVMERLEKIIGIRSVGMSCLLKNFWLFPIVVDSPDLFVQHLARYHVDAYRGTTQLNVITKLINNRSYSCPMSEYLIENVIYLPVHCYVPQTILDQLIQTVINVAEQIYNHSLRSKL